MAAHHIDPRAAPPLDGAVLDAKVVQARKFDAVVVPARHVPNLYVLDHDVVGRGLDAAAIVDVEPIVIWLLDREIANLNVANIGKLECAAAAHYLGRIARVCRRDDDRFGRGAVEVGQVNAAPVHAWFEEERRSWLGGGGEALKLLARADSDG